MAPATRPRTDREIKLCPVPEAPRQARRWIREHVLDLGFPDSVDDAALIVSELVTNALNAAPNCPIWGAVRTVAGLLILEVQDCSPKPPIMRDADFLAEGGRGLHVVQKLAIAFDWLPIPGGKIVWAVLT